MKVTDPHRVLEMLDINRLHELLGPRRRPSIQRKVPQKSKLTYVHPNSKDEHTKSSENATTSKVPSNPAVTNINGDQFKVYRGKVNLLGDYVDTDAVSYRTHPPSKIIRVSKRCSYSLPQLNF